MPSAVSHGAAVAVTAGVYFTDCTGRTYDLIREPVLSPKAAALDPRLGGCSIAQVLRMVRSGELRPTMKRNARVILIFDCALTDWRARQSPPRLSPWAGLAGALIGSKGTPPGPAQLVTPARGRR
jgi:hypothetical protein